MNLRVPGELDLRMGFSTARFLQTERATTRRLPVVVPLVGERRVNFDAFECYDFHGKSFIGYCEKPRRAKAPSFYYTSGSMGQKANVYRITSARLSFIAEPKVLRLGSKGAKDQD